MATDTSNVENDFEAKDSGSMDKAAVTAARVIPVILRSEAIGEVWERYYHMERDESPADELADAIEEAGADFVDNKELVKDSARLMGVLVNGFRKSPWLFKALRRKNAPANVRLKGQVQAIQNFLNHHEQRLADLEPKPDPVLMKDRVEKVRKSVSSNTRKLGGFAWLQARKAGKFVTFQWKDPVWNLDDDDHGHHHSHEEESKDNLVYALRDHTAQMNTLVQIPKGLWSFFKHVAHHTREESQKHFFKFSALLSSCIGLLVFMNLKIGGQKTYIDPVMMEVTNLDLESLLDPDFEPELDPNAYDPNMELPSHDHLGSLLGEERADWARESLPFVDELAPKHEAELMTLAQDGQGMLQGVYDFINIRIGGFIEYPVQDLVHKILPDSEPKDTIMQATERAAEVIYAGNAIENCTLHPLIGWTACLLAYQAGQMMVDGETAEAAEEVGNWFHRSLNVSPLSYSFLGASGAYAIASTGKFLSPELVWMSAIGFTVGEMIHKAQRSRLKDKFINAAFSDVASCDLDVFVNQDGLLEAKNDRSKAVGFLTSKFMVAAVAATGAAMTLDVAFNDAVCSLSMAGYSAVALPFLGYNAVEDTLAHIIFGVAGGVLGGTFGVATGATSKFLKRDRDMSDSPSPS